MRLIPIHSISKGTRVLQILGLGARPFQLEVHYSYRGLRTSSLVASIAAAARSAWNHGNIALHQKQTKDRRPGNDSCK